MHYHYLDSVSRVYATLKKGDITIPQTLYPYHLGVCDTRKRTHYHTSDSVSLPSRVCATLKKGHITISPTQSLLSRVYVTLKGHFTIPLTCTISRTLSLLCRVYATLKRIHHHTSDSVSLPSRMCATLKKGHILILYAYHLTLPYIRFCIPTILGMCDTEGHNTMPRILHPFYLGCMQHSRKNKLP
jgi:hypothetical protein